MATEKKTNYDGEKAKSDGKALKGQENVLKFDGDALIG